MPITDRNLPAGATLIARYKGADHTLLVLENDGKLAFELDGGTIYASLSAAGSAVMGGTACNGWRFWSRQGEETPTSERPTKKPAKPRRQSAARNRTPGPDFTKWTDERLAAVVADIERDLPALDGDVLAESQAELERARAELARRAEQAGS